MVPEGLFPLSVKCPAKPAPEDRTERTVGDVCEYVSGVPADSESERLSVGSGEPTGWSEVEASPSEVEASSSEVDLSPSEVSHVTGELEWDTCMLGSGDEEDEKIEDNDGKSYCN